VEDVLIEASRNISAGQQYVFLGLPSSDMRMMGWDHYSGSDTYCSDAFL
jgi:hypothetical protein